jgi:hypothetical protein
MAGIPEQQTSVDADLWKNSLAKELLVSDIKAGHISAERDDAFMTIQEAYESRDEFKATKRDLWANRLRSTREQIRHAVSLSEMDSDAFAHDSDLYPRSETTSSGILRWNGSEAEKQLR